MFTPKPSSKQKHMQTMQKHEIENAVRGSSRENSIFHPKTQFSSALIPNLLETQPRIILQVLPSIPILNPNSQILMNNNKTTC